MPEYQYKCVQCKTKFSIFIPIANKPNDRDINCPKCHRNGIVKRIFENLSFVLNGDGFYSIKNKKDKSKNT